MTTDSMVDACSSLIDEIIQRVEAELNETNLGSKKKKKSVNFCHVDRNKPRETLH